MAQSPLLLEIRGNSLDDGPGIRTVVFFKGCPLSCLWCHNPESLRREAEISYERESCLSCGECGKVCRSGAIRGTFPLSMDRSSCRLCFACGAACPSGSLARVGRRVEISEVLDAVLRDLPFFRSSGGGVTLSGGEPTLFPEYAGELARELRAKGVHVLLQTSGHYDAAAFAEHLLPHVDLIYFDLKLADDAAHRRFCGAGNELITTNFRELHARRAEGGPDVLPRVPLVPGITATRDNLGALAEILREVGAREVELLPYNPLWPTKRAMLGLPTTLSREALGEMEGLDRWMGEEELRACREPFEGLEILPPTP